MTFRPQRELEGRSKKKKHEKQKKRIRTRPFLAICSLDDFEKRRRLGCGKSFSLLTNLSKMVRNTP